MSLDIDAVERLAARVADPMCLPCPDAPPVVWEVEPTERGRSPGHPAWRVVERTGNGTDYVAEVDPEGCFASESAEPYARYFAALHPRDVIEAMRELRRMRRGYLFARGVVEAVREQLLDRPADERGARILRLLDGLVSRFVDQPGEGAAP